MTKLAYIPVKEIRHGLIRAGAKQVCDRIQQETGLEIKSDYYSPQGPHKPEEECVGMRVSGYITDDARAGLDAMMREQLAKLLGPHIMHYEEGEWTCSAPKFFHALSQSPDPAIRLKFESQHAAAVAKCAASITTQGEGGQALDQQYFANLAAGAPQKGKYFDVTKLCEYYDGAEGPNKPRYKFTSKKFRTTSVDNAIADDTPHLEKPNPEQGLLARNIVKAIQDFGVNRLRFEGRGSHCIAFSTPPNEEGKVQVVSITTPNHRFIPHPAMLPPMGWVRVEGNQPRGKALLKVYEGKRFTRNEAKEVEAIQNRDIMAGMQVRISPWVDLKNVKKSHVDALQELGKFENSGMVPGTTEDNTPEIKADNIGLLDYETKNEKGEKVKKTLPFLLDWYSFDHPRTAALPALKTRWENDPALADYREAQQYLKQEAGVKNFLPEPKQMRLFLDAHEVDCRADPERMAVLMGVYRECKLTPPELKAVAAYANKVFDAQPDFKVDPEIYHYVTHRYASQADVSLPHNELSQLPGKLKTAEIQRSQNFLNEMYERACNIPQPMRF